MVNVPQYEMVKKRFDNVEATKEDKKVWKPVTSISQLDSFFTKKKVSQNADRYTWELTLNKNLQIMQSLSGYQERGSSYGEIPKNFKFSYVVIADGRYGKEGALTLANGMFRGQGSEYGMYAVSLIFTYPNGPSSSTPPTANHFKIQGVLYRNSKIIYWTPSPEDENIALVRTLPGILINYSD